MVNERLIRPGYFTATPLGDCKETWPLCKETFIVDIEGYIIYLENHPELWAEIEGHSEQSPAAKDPSPGQQKQQNPSRIAKIKQCTNEKRLQWDIERGLLSWRLRCLRRTRNSSRQVKEDGKRYTRMDFSKEIQKARTRNSKLEFAKKTYTRE